MFESKKKLLEKIKELEEDLKSAKRHLEDEESRNGYNLNIIKRDGEELTATRATVKLLEEKLKNDAEKHNDEKLILMEKIQRLLELNYNLIKDR